MIKFSTSNKPGKTEAWLNKLKSQDPFGNLDAHGQAGVAALAAATPTESGLTAESWYYEIVRRPGYVSLRWFNSNSEDGRQPAIMLQYGHATGTGGYVQGTDYINPAIRPIFDRIDAEVRKAVSN